MRLIKNLQKSLFCQWSEHKFSKELQEISKILDDNPNITKLVHEDLASKIKRKDLGSQGMSSEQVLRAAILKQQNKWSYEFLELQCVDSEMTKSFIRLDYEETYSASCLQENISKIRGETWQKISDEIVKYAQDNGVENGRTVRMDATVVESNIHAPTDSSLIWDCIKVVDRVLQAFRDELRLKLYMKISTNEAKNLVLSIFNSKTNKKRKLKYRRLIKMAKSLNTQLIDIISSIEEYDFSAQAFLVRQFKDLKNVSELLPLIIDQTERRVIKEQAVPSNQKIVSIFEPHTDIIVKGKRETEYGHKVFLTAGKSGLVLDCQLVQGNPSDSQYFIDLVERQIDLFGKAPRQTTADGGFASEDNVLDAKDLGVKDVCFSKRCGLSIEEMVKSPWVFQKLRNFRAGIEAVISFLKRCFGLARVTWRRVSGFASYVHSSIVAYNLTILARRRLAIST
jgi:transposase, IS5 family